MGLAQSRSLSSLTDRFFHWEINKTVLPSGEYSKSAVFNQNGENFCAFYDFKNNQITIYCCSAEQWHYDEMFTFNFKIFSENYYPLYMTAASITKKSPFCTIILNETPEVLLFEIDVCENYPYTRKDRYLGIRNSGSTCYMASILQILYHTTCFRNLIYSFKDNSSACLELQKLFINLQLSSRAPSPDAFIRSLGSEQELASVQHDAHEFLISLFERFETDLGQPFIQPEKQIFGGVTTTTIKCDSINFEKTTEEEFITIPVVVDGLRSLKESLALQTAMETLSDEYDAGECGKGQATQQISFTKLPPILAFQLCRFRYNKKTGSVVEIKTVFDCPFELDMEPYYKGDQLETTEYELYGITAHSGNPMFGHYTSFLRPGLGEQWIQFNDGATKMVDEQVVHRLFGTQGSSQPSFFHAFSFSSAVAYMVFYVRKDQRELIAPSDNIPLHLAPHRSNLHFSRFILYENLVGSPLNTSVEQIEWQNGAESIESLARKANPSAEIKPDYHAWAQMPGRSHFIGPLDLSTAASDYVIKGHSTSFLLLPPELDSGPILVTSAKVPKTILGVTTSDDIGKVVPDGCTPRFQNRELTDSSILAAGDAVAAVKPKNIVLRIRKRRYQFPPQAVYADAQKRVAMEKNIPPTHIIFLKGSTPLKPAGHQLLTSFPSTQITYQVMKGDATACSISLFTPLHVCFFIHNSTYSQKKPIWVRKGTSVKQLKEMATQLAPARFQPNMRVIVSRGCEERVYSIMPPNDIPAKESVRFDIIRYDAPYTKSMFKYALKNKPPFSIEVRFTPDPSLEVFIRHAHFVPVTPNSVVNDIISNAYTLEKMNRDQNENTAFLFIAGKPKIKQQVDADQNMKKLLQEFIGKMTKANQRVAIAIVSTDPVACQKQSIIPRSLSGIINKRKNSKAAPSP